MPCIVRILREGREKGMKKKLGDLPTEAIERLSEKVHQAYCDLYLEQKGRHYWTRGDYSKLDEPTKEINRKTVRAVLKQLEKEIDLPDHERGV